MRYIVIDNLMNESLSFSTILTKVTFVTASVVSLMPDSTFFVLELPLGTFILTHVLAKCYFKAFVASPEVLEFSAETRHSGLPNRTPRF
jgi:hypothetical protein